MYINRYLFLAQPSQKTIWNLLSNIFLTSSYFSFEIMMNVHANTMQAKEGLALSLQT